MSKLNKLYLGYTFSIMSVCWALCIMCSLNGISLKDNYLLYIPYLLGGLSPTIASFISLKKSNNILNFKDWSKNIFDFRHNIYSYLTVIILSVILISSQCFICGYEKGAPLFVVIFMIPMMIIGGGLEEAGWRYILQPELEKKFSFTLSTIITAVIWWIWHLPLFFIQGVFQYGQDFFVFGINVLGLAFALASIRKNTNSVWLCILFHSLINSLNGVYMINFDNIWGCVVTAIILIICSYALLLINKKKQIFN